MPESRVPVFAISLFLISGLCQATVVETWIQPVVPAGSVPAAPTPAPAAKGKKKSPGTAKPPATAPSRPMIAAGDSGLVELTSGSKFPAAEIAIAKDRLDRSMVRLGSGRPFPLTGAKTEDRVTKLEATYIVPGTATIGVQLTPVAVDRKGPEFEAYLAELGASEAQADRQKKKETKKAAREIAIATAKAFVGVHDPTGRMKVESGGPSPADPLDLPLEFTVEGDPLALRAGGSATAVLLQGKLPVPNHPVRMSLGSGQTSVLSTDAAGRVSLTSLAEGRLLLAASTIRRVTKDEKKKSELYKKADWESLTTSLSLEVLAAAPAQAPAPTPTPRAKPKKK